MRCWFQFFVSDLNSIRNALFHGGTPAGFDNVHFGGGGLPPSPCCSRLPRVVVRCFGQSGPWPLVARLSVLSPVSCCVDQWPPTTFVLLAFLVDRRSARDLTVR